ncbi:hypothetical protein Tco_1533041 [Tanacetum coccineum]
METHPLDLKHSLNSDYGGFQPDRKPQQRGCQFLWSTHLSHWQCKKQTIVATQQLKLNMPASSIAVDRYYLVLKRVMQDQLGHGKENAQGGHLLNWINFGCNRYWVHRIVGFLRRSKLRYALTHNPPIYDSLIKQFWQTATARTLADGTQQLNATIDTIEHTITERSVRRQLQLAKMLSGFILQNEEIFEGLQNIGSKSGGWIQFGSNIAIALICLSTGRDFNFSKLIFDGMISNLKSKSKFLMYPRLGVKSTIFGKRNGVETKPSLGTEILQAEREVKKLEDNKIYKRKSKSTKTPTKILHFEEPDSAQVNTAQVNTAELNPDSTSSAQINTGEVNAAEVNTGEVNAAEVNTGEAERAQRRKGKEPMTEEDIQAEVQASKTSKELQELADLEEAKRVQAQMDAETQRQIDLDALLARRLVEQEEEAAREALATEFDYIQARLNADQILAEKIQQEEREQYTIEERAKFLHDTIAAQRKFLAEQRSAIIRNKPPTISQLRNQMITYLKHVANKKHAELKSKSFEEIQVLYERYKKQDQTFVAIGSKEDERAIKKMNEKDADKEEEKKDESVHEEVQEEEGAKKRKLGTRRKLKAKRRKHGSSLTREDDDLKICLHISPDEDKVIDVESLDHQYPIIEWQSFFLTTKPQHDQTKPDEDIYLNKVTRSNGHQRFFRTLMGVLSILDREDLKVIYELVMEEYKDRLPEGFDRMLWGDLMIMFNQGDTADFWDTQQDWKLISWKLHSSSGVHTIMTSTGLVFHMLVESKYPLTKEVLSQMLDLKLEKLQKKALKALELIKFVKQQLEEFEDSEDDDPESHQLMKEKKGIECWRQPPHKKWPLVHHFNERTN